MVDYFYFGFFENWVCGNNCRRNIFSFNYSIVRENLKVYKVDKFFVKESKRKFKKIIYNFRFI